MKHDGRTSAMWSYVLIKCIVMPVTRWERMAPGGERSDGKEWEWVVCGWRLWV